jgi:hypothetical protein
MRHRSNGVEPLFGCVRKSSESARGYRTGLSRRLRDAETNSSHAGLGNLRGGYLMEIIGCSLGMCGCRKNGAAVTLENPQPGGNMGGILFPSFRA